MKIKKPLILIAAIAICQLAGIVGAFFTTSAIPTWYMSLTKPSFNPPSWIFGPVWVLLYTLMGIAVHRIWIKGGEKKNVSFAVKVFGIHLILNSLWTIIFFGIKNPGVAFFEIVVLWVFIIFTIKLFWKIERVAGLLLLPYLAWVSFAALLNFSIWNLNPKPVNTIFAQEFDYQKAYSDYVYKKDVYGSALADFNQKKDSYLKNPTLSLKEEARLSFYGFLVARNDVITTYLTATRMRVLESNSLAQEEKDLAISQVTEEYKWFTQSLDNYSKENTLEELLSKSKDEDARFSTETTTAINYVLAVISYSDLVDQKQKHQKIYESLKEEANSLVDLGRADSSLFERWFLDIGEEFGSLENTLSGSKENLQTILSAESYAQKRGFNTIMESFEPAKQSLLKINQFLSELENIVEEKR